MPVKLGDLLLRERLVTAEQLQQAVHHQKSNGVGLTRALVTLGFVGNQAIAKMLSRHYGTPAIDLDRHAVDPALVQLLPIELANKHLVLPVSHSGATLTIATADPTKTLAMDEIRYKIGYNVATVVASECALEDAIERCYGSNPTPAPVQDGASTSDVGLTVDDLAAIGGLSDLRLDSLGEIDPDEATQAVKEEIDLGTFLRAPASPAVKLLNAVLVEAFRRGASHIYVEPYETNFRIRFRIDGVLYNVMALPLELRVPVAQRVKFMARLNVSLRQLRQDGVLNVRLVFEDRSRELAFRVCVRPTLWGETIVLRSLDRSKLPAGLAPLGFEPHSLERFLNAIARPHGIVLVGGPHRSGRTSTLSAAIATLNKPDIHIVTAEDPVELQLPGVNQVAVNEHVEGQTMAAVLRSFRQADADIVAVDELSNSEGTRAVVGLAQDGRLVLSTLAASDASSTPARLLNMGIEASALATTVNLILAQRLVRRICAQCRFDASADVQPMALAHLGFLPEEIGSFPVMRGKGCAACSGTGYRGQVGLFEVLEISEAIRELILLGAVAIEIKRKALEEGMLTLRMSGLEKVRSGVTTIEEVLRTTVL